MSGTSLQEVRSKKADLRTADHCLRRGPKELDIQQQWETCNEGQETGVEKGGLEE
jgi:hypothetical protein